MKFLANQPALLLGKTLVVSDIHLGIEHEYRSRGIRMPSQTAAMKVRLETLLKQTKASRLIICGDLKHKVPGTTFQEQKELPEFLKSIRARIEIAQGNHDADLKPLLPPQVRLHSTRGFLHQEAYCTHGHTWPDPEFLKAKAVVMGHVQPQIEIRDKLGYCWREQVWVRAALDKKKIQAQYPKVRLPNGLPELIILPSFNPLAGGLALNAAFSKKPAPKRELLCPSPSLRNTSTISRLSPLLKLANMKKAKIHLLDGTLLGELGRL